MFLFITRNIYQTSYTEMFFATFKNTVIIFKLFYSFNLQY